MKIIINAHGYVGQAGGAGGAGVFLQYLTRELAKRHAVDVLVPPGGKLFAGRGGSERFVELPYISAEVLRHLREGPSVVLDPFGALPALPFPDDLGLVGVIHDLMHLDMPQFFGASERRGRSAIFAAGVQRHDAVVVFSADQANAVRRHYPGTTPRVIHHLPYTCLGKLDVREPATPAVVRVVESGPYLLMPAVRWPHKNHRTVIQAFRHFVQLHPESELRLVLCGGPCAESRFSFFPELDLADERIVDLGRVDDPSLQLLFERAAALAFPTLHEGFGIPVLEAAYMGKMVVASKLDVFDEILGHHTYRSVAEPLCHLRWIEAFASVESTERRVYEGRSAQIATRIQPNAFISQFEQILQEVAERYTHPSFYPQRGFRNGDRLATTLLAPLDFVDLHGTVEASPSSRLPALGPGAPTRQSVIFRAAASRPEFQQCLRSSYTVTAPTAPDSRLEFFAWMRLHAGPELTALNWSVNDGSVVDLLPVLGDGDWHIVRQPVPSSGYIDLRGVDGERSEVPGVELELHDPCIMLSSDVQMPVEPRPARTLTLVIAALAPKTDLAALLGELSGIAEALGRASTGLRAVLVLNRSALNSSESAVGLPEWVRVHLVSAAIFKRQDAVGIFSPYDPLSLVVLLEAVDLGACLTPENLEILREALSGRPLSSAVLSFERTRKALWSNMERGILLDVAERSGQPIPVLDPLVLGKLVVTPAERTKPRFACIETDLTSLLSHHATVTGLFLDGAAALGFEPVLGIHRSAVGKAQGKVKSWSGFSAQVYQPGRSEAFAEELTDFVDAMELGSGDLIFMHSLSPQILLGAARFVAGRPATAPRFAFRFFSTAEAMRGHGLSYVRILRSIFATACVRERMTFFVESVNLQNYYQEEVGQRFEILFNPQHPALAMVRDSGWLDPNLGGKAPTLAYFGEAREEKGFDFLPRILGELLAAPEMQQFRFIIQTGSNANNQTPRMNRAKVDLDALRRRYPDRLRTFQSAETPEQFYFIMKHAQGLIAPYRAESYGKRGTGVTLEALQMGMTAFATVDTDLYATFANTGRMIGAIDIAGFARTIIDHYAKLADAGPTPAYARLLEGPSEVVRRLLKACDSGTSSRATAAPAPVLWVGNDTFGEGCSAVYQAQKTALAALGRDRFELFVPWPDRNQAGVDPGQMDAVLYGFDSRYDANGLAWIARPNFGPALYEALTAIESKGATHRRLIRLNEHFTVPVSLQNALSGAGVTQTVLNYAHLHSVIRDFVPMEQITLETHDLQSYQHALRNGVAVSQIERIDELQDLARFPRVIAISRKEYGEISSACARSRVVWQVPPLATEPAPSPLAPSPLADVAALNRLCAVPATVVGPTAAMLGVFYSRADLARIFDLSRDEGRLGYFRWWAVFGQFENDTGASLTEEQAAWLLDEEAAPDAPLRLPGMLMLLLSLRSDLQEAFIKGSQLNATQLRKWAKDNIAGEYGFDFEALKAQRAALTRPRWPLVSGNTDVLAAIAAANPTGLRCSPDQARPLFNQLADVQAIDILLVGSGHPSNVQSFKWFISEVYLKYLAAKGRNLFIVGSACEQLKQYTHRNIHLLGRCELIRPMIEAARTCPVPVIMGSGSAIKTIPVLGWNGAVTITDHIDASFGLSEYGFPVCSDAREFAEDVALLLRDPREREARRQLARAYVAENLTTEGYVAFWRDLLQSTVGMSSALSETQRLVAVHSTRDRVVAA